MEQMFVFFDFDNTLVDSLRYWYKILNKDMFIKYNKKIDKDFPRKRKGLSNLEIAQVFVDITGVDKTAVEINDEVYSQMEIYYKNKIHMLKGAKEFLLKLKTEGKKLILITATDLSLVKIALEHFGIYQIFEWIFTEESIGKHKRDTEFLEYCFSVVKCKKDDILLFEDSVASLKSAIRLGIDSFGIIHKYNKKTIRKLRIPLLKNYKNIEKILKKKG